MRVAALFAVDRSLVCAHRGEPRAGLAGHADQRLAALKQDPGSSRRAATVRGLLAAGQLALSLVLLIGAGLMGRAFVSLRSVPLGFEPDRALTMTISLQGQRFNQRHPGRGA